MIDAPAAAPRACAICRKPQVEEYRPFCSKRCADIDLHRWLAGVYVAPGRPAEEEGEEAASQSPIHPAGH